MWGRWAQQWAIARYPYLKKEGKGALHQDAFPSLFYVLPSLFFLIGATGLLWLSHLIPTAFVIRSIVSGLIFSLLTNAYFVKQLGGHTGDTYGAVVEWTEAFMLCSLSGL